ncbi:hypothetical protein [Tengunoibacter tsumagoiensis]|uniref:Uncharacterized protein n=1 Tax=Tengunoibacter tsumagoiensis TaxID=2014871 RepID=A0A402A6R7_9CHLR|nr:hypothetical protein [Tengunoibacter tsumagoiensis]GCE14789.1 hypothetical protein KTT_46480 [Tengunoibacter tsumagoiensis]
MWAELQTMRMTYQEIVQEIRPWNALGDFMNYFFGYTPDRRDELVREPLEVPVNGSTEAQRWAVFCAAAVEYLCHTYNLICPDWVAAYQGLAEPWFEGLGADKPHVQERLRRDTPEAFAKRNIFCGTRVFSNKYEAAKLRPRLSA